MYKIAVLSDSHRKVDLTQEAIDMLKSKGAEYIAHAGDLELKKNLDILENSGLTYVSVFGNNDEVKKYYLKELSNIKISDVKFDVDTKIDELLQNSISIWFNQYEEPFEVKLYANKWAAKYFKRRPLPTQSILSLNEDGSMEFVVKITHEMEILPIVKYWLPNVRVMEPIWISDIIKNDLKDYLTN